MLGQDDDGGDSAAALDIFPAAAGHDANVLALPLAFGRVIQAVVGHSSMSLSGISFLSSPERGKCSESTTPICSIAATMPSATRPSRTWPSSAVIASPQVSAVVTEEIGRASCRERV